MKERRLAAASSGAVLVWFLGCSGVNSYSTGEPRSNVELTGQVVRDASLHSAIEIVSSRIDERGGMKFAQVTVRNDSSATRGIEYRFDWFDAEGVNVTPLNEGFRALTLAPGESRDLQSSVGRQASDFRFVVRNASR